MMQLIRGSLRSLLSAVVLFVALADIAVADDPFDREIMQHSPFIRELLPLRKNSLWINIDSIVAKYIQPGVDVLSAKVFLLRNGFVIRSHSIDKLSANYKTASRSSIIDTDIVISMEFDQNRVTSISGTLYNGLFFMGNFGFIRNVDRSLFNAIWEIKGQWGKLNITKLVEKHINLEMSIPEIEEIMFNNGFRLFKYDNRHFRVILEDNHHMELMFHKIFIHFQTNENKVTSFDVYVYSRRL